MRDIRGVTDVRIHNADARLTIRYDAAVTDEAQVLAALQGVIDRVVH